MTGGPGGLFRRYERELVCGRCRNVLAQVSLGLWSRLHIVSTRGVEITPVGGWLLHHARQRVATLRAEQVEEELRSFHDDELAQAEQRLAYLLRGAGEIHYELDCSECAASYLRSLPALVAEIRAAQTGRVTLDRQLQDTT
ncbi:MAG: hypothetical protein QOF57_2498 [Frankiaceae bacterium]|jgi:exonuclease VII small subunit|nr:hypothetical protein [Frankiaceae bacterium]